MKAVRFREHGGPDVLHYEDVPDPVPGPGEALVRVRACALNYLDIWARRGLPRVKTPLPHISGSDVAGEMIAAPGSGISAGTRVMIQPGVSCGLCIACLSGRDNECRAYEVLGYLHHDGGYAELLKVPIQNLLPIPDHIDFASAAAFPLTFLTAWHMLVTKAGIQRGEEVLILGGGSGVGQAGIQVARLFGARVIATAGSEDKLERARGLGATDVIDHYRQDIAAEVRRLTNKRGVDIVFEHVGAATWSASVSSLARGGRLVTCGATTGTAATVDLAVLFAKRLSLLGSYMGTKGELIHVAQLFFAGELKPVVDRTYPLREAAAAQERMEASRHFGKIVLDVP